MPRYWEDIDDGESLDLGRVQITTEAVIEFGERWDPLPQHTDPAVASESFLGELLASGLHTVCLSNRLVAEQFRRELAGSVGLGFDDVRWPAAVTPGDRVRFHHEVLATRPSESDPSRGVLRTRVTGEVDGKGLVMTYETAALVRRRGVDSA